MKNELAELGGIKMVVRNFNNIRHADDIVFLADTEEKLQRLLDELNVQCRIKELKINKSMTEVIAVSKRRGRLAVNINKKGVAINQVVKFRYLGSLVREDGRCDEEI